MIQSISIKTNRCTTIPKPNCITWFSPNVVWNKLTMIKNLINTTSGIVLLNGLFGMLFSFPYLWSGNTIDVIGAGLPFAAGAVLFGTELISSSINNRRN